MGDGERRLLTYGEVGEAGLARVGVPAVELHRASGDTHPVGHASRRPWGRLGDRRRRRTGDKPDGSAALVLALDRVEALAGQVGHARAEVAHLRAEAACGRAAAEAAATEAGRRAKQAEDAALDAWRTAAELAARLAAVRSPTTPVRSPPAPPRRGGLPGSPVRAVRAGRDGVSVAPPRRLVPMR